MRDRGVSFFLFFLCSTGFFELGFALYGLAGFWGIGKEAEGIRGGLWKCWLLPGCVGGIRHFQKGRLKPSVGKYDKGKVIAR